jgi:hypothetical protein
MKAPRILEHLLRASLVLVLFSAGALAGTPSDDFVTGGGWIIGPGGAKANFGVKGGVDVNGAFIGHLNYVDHSNKMHVKGVSITNYVVVDATTREIQGTATVDGMSVTFTVRVSDAGEPGTSDTFAISLSSGYNASGTLQGGNIQLHVCWSIDAGDGGWRLPGRPGRRTVQVRCSRGR